MPRWPSSIRTRLTLWYTLLLAIPLATFALLSYAAFSRALVSSTDRFIGEALEAFTRELGAERRAGLTLQQAMFTTVNEVRFRELHIAIFDSAWRVVAAASPPGADGVNNQSIVAALRTPGVADAPVMLTLSSPDGDHRVRAHSLDADGQSFVVAGHYPLREAESMMGSIRRMFGIAIPMLILFAAVSGWFLAQRSLAPVTSMATHAAEISASTLHERLPVSGGDELVRLARVINDLLDRLERSFEQQRRFMADASHELRTPTAIVRTEADVTLSRDHRGEAEYRESVRIMGEASRRMARIVDDLFLLARADAGHLVFRAAPIYLEEVVDDAARSVRHLADQQGVTIEMSDLVEAPVSGDADLLTHLLLNLLDNAIKHSPRGGAIRLSLVRRGAMFRVSVIDQGAGIPVSAQRRVFERFFRSDEARARDEGAATSGAGLGLAIARRIAEIHGGTLDLVESRPGHTEFRFEIPAAQVPAESAGVTV
ncbi:MAG TPA: ATP-binding protein [Gemmatimonadaceae bacterium]